MLLQVTVSRDAVKVQFLMHLDEEGFESDKNIKTELGNGQPYEKEITDLFMKLLRPGDTVIDVGANVGWFSLLASQLVGPNGDVVAVEPAPANIVKLRENVAANANKNITVIEGACSDKGGAASLFLNPEGNGGHALWDMQAGKEDKHSTVCDVKTFTIDELTEYRKQVRILKIDTEGADLV